MTPLRSWLATAGDLLFERLDRWALDGRLAARAIRMLPACSSGYRLLAKSYIKKGEPALAVDLLLASPERVRCASPVAAVLDKALRDNGDHVRAHSVLLNARAAHPSDPEILVRL